MFPVSPTAAWRSGSLTSIGRSRARRAAYATSHDRIEIAEFELK